MDSVDSEIPLATFFWASTETAFSCDRSQGTGLDGKNCRLMEDATKAWATELIHPS